MKKNDVEIGGCVEIVRGKRKGKIGVVEDFISDDYAAVRVWFEVEHESFPELIANLEKC